MKKLFLFIILTVWMATPQQAHAEEYKILTNIMPPLKYEQDGVFQGICIDLLVEMLLETGEGNARNKITASSWSRAYSETQSQPGTILASMAMTDKRKDDFKWVGPIYQLHLGLIGKKQRNFVISNLDDLRKLNVGSQTATAPETLLFEMGFPQNKAHRVPEVKSSLMMLEQDRIDLLVHAVEPAMYTMETLGIDSSKYRTYMVLKHVNIYVALNKSFSDEFVTNLQKALEALKQPGPNGVSRYDEIVGRYTRQ